MCDEPYCLMQEFTNEWVQDYIDACCAELQIESGRIDWCWDDETEMGNSWGVCYGDDEEQNIEINCGSPSSKIYTTIAHELIHCWQHQRGALREDRTNALVPGLWWTDNDGNESFYADLQIQQFIEKLTDDELHEAYLNRPWEREAYALQDRIADKALLRLLDKS